MPVHVPHEEVKDGKVYHVEESPAPVVGTDLLHYITVVGIVLPGRLSPLVVTPAPGMSPGLPRHNGLARQEGGEAGLEHVRATADRVRSITVVGALAMEAEVSRRRDEEGL